MQYETGAVPNRRSIWLITELPHALPFIRLTRQNNILSIIFCSFYVHQCSTKTPQISISFWIAEMNKAQLDLKHNCKKEHGLIRVQLQFKAHFCGKRSPLNTHVHIKYCHQKQWDVYTAIIKHHLCTIFMLNILCNWHQQPFYQSTYKYPSC